MNGSGISWWHLMPLKWFWNILGGEKTWKRCKSKWEIEKEVKIEM